MERPPVTFNKARAVLLLVDIQPDFLPGGGLPVADGSQIIEPVRLLMESDKFCHYVATQDWHPPGHVSFASSHPGAEPMATLEINGYAQTLWPDHCIQGTSGAELHGDLPWEKVAAIIRKGTDPESDSYSGFHNNWNSAGERPATGLAGYLRERGIEELFICGLARDVCIKWTAEDGANAGFNVYVLWDLTRPVEPSSDDQVRRELIAHDVKIIDWEQLVRY
ncbi:Nicotinamidase [Nitrosococcus oceani ATCC 19707]|uniref:nicotinamidase n=2 Tax=Nitrosococcus oceani TaxID=1229 RepID=Q3JEE5_NITOC|nr:nicotinamidase [Nitrosococcus oceani]ABA56801.1 Nicotinamidase [Nitrosococcus oceani ATCC 19707]KFI20755.1 nicotinamidase [Nitrosococcus oceani C-27]GEM20558.1 nicotinamidase [Nitrosococcus oceani]